MRQAIDQGKDVSPFNNGDASPKQAMSNVSDDLQVTSVVQDQIETSNEEEKRVPAHDRLRVPISYDDDLLGGDPKDDEA